MTSTDRDWETFWRFLTVLCLGACLCLAWSVGEDRRRTRAWMEAVDGEHRDGLKWFEEHNADLRRRIEEVKKR